MGIAELAPLHKKQRLIRRHQLANSKDPRVRQIHNDLGEYQAQRDKHGSLKRGTNEWKECVEMDKLLAEVKTNKIKGSAQTNRAGLGYGPSKHKRRIPSGPKGEREQMLRVFTEIEEEARIVRALTQKKHFSEWLKWQCALAVDLSWQQLLHKQSDSFLRFLLNSIEDSLPTPSVLKCWRQASAGDGKCPWAATMQALSSTSCAVVRLPTEPAKRHPKVASPGAMTPSCSLFTMLSKSRWTRPILLTRLTL